jgi:membrane-bound serine protease (ClpP class)
MMLRGTINRQLPFVVGLVVLGALAPPRATAARATVPADTASTGPVLVGDVDGAIGPATVAYVERLIRLSHTRRARCIVLRMDTPGGLSESMRDIIQAVLASDVPVVTYVSPGGARAASAGALIALASHVAAMAPGTNIGAAHPVSIGPGGGATGASGPDSVMEEKITNDAAAFARSIASRRGRNVEWAERVVRKSISSTADEALREKVIDLVAPDLAALLASLDGREVEVPSGRTTLHTAGAAIETVPPSFRERFLARISDPNIAYLLMLAGVFGLIFELQNPGAVLPGVVGVVALVTAAFALQMLPVNWTGLALILIAIVLFILDIKVPSHGALTIGGIVAMLIGSIMLIDTPVPFMRVSLAVIVPSVVFTALFFLFAVGMGIRAQRRRVTTGNQGLVGQVGVARTDVHDDGSVFVHGEYWNAFSDKPVPAGTRVVVAAVDGMRVRVEPKS